MPDYGFADSHSQPSYRTIMTPRTRQLVISLIVACAMFMQSLDSTIIATALPAIAGSLGERPLRLSVAIMVFTLGSIGCGLAQSLWMLVIARIVQGMGGAMMVPVGRLVLLRTVPKSELVRAMSYVSVPALIGPVIGPPLGGFIVTYASWHWIFFINIPIGHARRGAGQYVRREYARGDGAAVRFAWVCADRGGACQHG